MNKHVGVFVLMVAIVSVMVVSMSMVPRASEAQQPSNSPQAVKVAWEQAAADFTSLDKWTLYWSDTETGAFTKVADIPYTGGAGPTFTSEQPITVTGQPGQQVTKYFRMTAWSKTGKESGPSNTASGAFAIPFRDVTVPQSVVIQVVVVPAPAAN